MAGVRLHYQPDFASWLQLEGIARRQREMDFHLHSAIHFCHYDHIALRQ